MAPLHANVEATALHTTANAGLIVANDFRSQWINPSDIFPLLLLVGGDIVQKALAQFSLNRFRPVAFSLGWVAYAFSALFFTIGNLKDLPDPDCPCILMGVSERSNSKTNQSWLLGRLIRNHEYWSKPLIDDAQKEHRVRDQDVEQHTNFRIFVYDVVDLPEDTWTVAKDWPWFSGIICTLLQLAVASVPAALYLEWEILAITAAGTALTYATAHIFAPTARARKGHKGAHILIEDAGSYTPVVVRGNGKGPNLGDLASVTTPGARRAWRLIAASVQLVLWVALLITVSGLHTNTWYMICIGSVGMLQNIVLAGAPRTPSSLGIPLQLSAVVAERRVSSALKRLEELEPFAGATLLPILFPGGLRDSEMAEWEEIKKSSRQKRDKPRSPGGIKNV